MASTVRATYVSLIFSRGRPVARKFQASDIVAASLQYNKKLQCSL